MCCIDRLRRPPKTGHRRGNTHSDRNFPNASDGLTQLNRPVASLRSVRPERTAEHALGKIHRPTADLAIWNLCVHSSFKPSLYGFLVRLLTPECHANHRFDGGTKCAVRGRGARRWAWGKYCGNRADWLPKTLSRYRGEGKKRRKSGIPVAKTD